MFIKNKPITRIATLFLTLTVLFTSINLTPLITHAADGVNGELAVTNKQNISGSGGWADIRQGYRFYIIDRTCTRQSDIYDFVYEMPTELGVMYTNTRWEPTSTDKSYLHLAPISDLVNLCQGSTNASDILNILPMFITSKDARYVNGDEFQYWFIGTVSGDTPLDLPSSGTTGGNTGGGSSQIGAGQNIAERTPEEQQQLKEEQKQNALSKATTMSTVLNSFDNKISNCTSYYHNHYYEYFNKNKQRINNSISILKGIFASYATNGKELGLSDAEAKAYASYFVYQTLAGGYPDNIKNWITCAIAYSACFDGNGKTYYTNDLNSSTGIHTLAKINLPQSKINSILPDPLLLNQNIPLAGATTLYPADKMLGQANGIKVYNFNKDITGDGSVTALDALRYEIDGIYQYYLVVEPIAWINVFIDGDHHEALRSYGSYYNLLNKYNELGNDSASGMHASYIKELGKNSLVVKRDYTEMVYPVTKGTNSARMTVSQILSEIKGRNAGYGMQIYCGKDMDPTRKEAEVTPPTTPDTPYTLTESQISRATSTGDLLSEEEISITYPQLSESHNHPYKVKCPGISICTKKYFTGEYKCKLDTTHNCATDHSCSGTAKNPCSRYHKHTEDCKVYACGGHEIIDDYKPMTLNDPDIKISLKQLTEHPVIVQSVLGATEYTNKVSDKGNATLSSYSTTLSGFNYDFIIHRGNKDTLNQYEGVSNNSNGVKEVLDSLNIARKTGAKSTRTENASKQYNVTLKFENADTPDPYTSSKCTIAGCNHTDTEKCLVGGKEVTTPITIQTYAGLLNSTVVDTKVNPNTIITLSPFDGRPQTTGGKSYPSSGVMVQSPSTISFLPYIRMTYQTLKGTTTPVNILGKYIRAINPNNYAEVSWKETNTYNINVVSQQWSVHEAATGTQAQLNGTPLKPWQGKNQVLPGGAMYSLNTKDLNQKVY